MVIKGNNSQLRVFESNWKLQKNLDLHVYLFKIKYIIIYVYINKIFMYDGHFRGPFQAEIQIILSVVVRWFVPIDLALPFIDLKIISFFFLTAYSKYQAKKFSNIIMFHFLYYAVFNSEMYYCFNFDNTMIVFVSFFIHTVFHFWQTFLYRVASFITVGHSISTLFPRIFCKNLMNWFKNYCVALKWETTDLFRLINRC